MQTAQVHVKGVAPLIQHNGRLIDPLDPFVRAIARVSKRRNKTDDDHLEISRLEFFAGLYTVPVITPDDRSPDGVQVVISSEALERVIRDGAAQQKLGKVVQSAAIVTDDFPLIYQGPKDPEDLWASGRFISRASCKVGQSRVIRTRPIFSEWECKFEVAFHEDLLDADRLRTSIEVGGREKGLGDWRPKHGRFEVVSFEVQ